MHLSRQILVEWKAREVQEGNDKAGSVAIISWKP